MLIFYCLLLQYGMHTTDNCSNANIGKIILQIRLYNQVKK
jgi:hypothetical protein